MSKSIKRIYELIYSAEYQLEPGPVERDWNIEIKIFLNGATGRYLPRLYRRDRFNIAPWSSNSEGETTNETLLVEEVFLWDDGDEIIAASLDEAFSVLHAKMMHRLGEPIDQSLLSKIIGS